MEFTLTKKDLLKLSKENNYSANNIEKVLRLCDILTMLNTDSRTSGELVLKGGTAINLVAFEHIPRLSVDLDFNYAYNVGKDDMIEKRSNINAFLNERLAEKGYQISYRKTFTLDSISLKYKTISGCFDKIKLDINYQNRCHIFEAVNKTIAMPFWGNGRFGVRIKSLQDIELFAGKIKAFYERCKPRDVFDIYTIAKSGRINSDEIKCLLRKCILFYGCIGNTSRKPIFGPDVKNLLEMPFLDIKTQLLPMLHLGCGKYPKDEINNTIIEFLGDLMNPDDNDIEFWNKFMDGEYEPGLIFDDDIADKLRDHPVALYTLKVLMENKDEMKTEELPKGIKR